jgi:hypothetical protein
MKSVIMKKLLKSLSRLGGQRKRSRPMIRMNLCHFALLHQKDLAKDQLAFKSFVSC